MSYNHYIKVEEKYLPKHGAKAYDKMEPGHYEVSYIRDLDQYIFEKITFNHDELLELPSKEFKVVADQIDTFLTKETKELFKQYKYIYKRSILMHGVPGTGKTCLVNRIANKVVQEGGIVLFNPNPELLPGAFKALTEIQPDTNVVVVFEELDKLVKTFEGPLLSLLDGEIQRDNVIYLATTNYISKVPARIMRPGRFSSIVEIKYPNADSRRFYLNQKMGKLVTKTEINDLVKNTNGLSIDELKEVVLSTKCLQLKFDEVMKRIQTTKKLCKNDDVFDEYDEYDYQGGTLGSRDARDLNRAIVEHAAQVAYNKALPQGDSNG